MVQEKHDEFEGVSKTLNQLKAEVLAAVTKIDQLEKKLARGTRDLAPISPDVSLSTKIEVALRFRPMTLVELSETVKQTPGKTIVAVRRLKDHVHNLGTESSPLWSWKIGDNGPTDELRDVVERLIRTRPLTHQDLIEATGARGNRISGVLVKLQVSGKPVQNLGTRAVARWFIPPMTQRPRQR